MNEEGLIHLDLGIILRLPPLYLMDSLLGNNLGVSLEPSLQPVIEEQINMTEKISQSSDLYSTFTTLSGTSPALLILSYTQLALVPGKGKYPLFYYCYSFIHNHHINLECAILPCNKFPIFITNANPLNPSAAQFSLKLFTNLKFTITYIMLNIFSHRSRY